MFINRTEDSECVFIMKLISENTMNVIFFYENSCDCHRLGARCMHQSSDGNHPATDKTVFLIFKRDRVRFACWHWSTADVMVMLNKVFIDVTSRQHT